MSYLKDLLSQLSNLSTVPNFSPPNNLSQAKINVARLLGNITPRKPSAYDLLETYNVLASTDYAVSSLINLPSKHLKRAPWVMFEPMQDNAEVLADSREFLAAFIDTLHQRLFSPAIINLAVVFVRIYPEDKPYFDFLRTKITSLVDTLETPKGRLLRERAERYGLYSENGTKILGQQLLESAEPLELLAEAGFDDASIRRGFVLSAVKETMTKMSWKLRSNEIDEQQLGVLLRFFEADGTDAGALRYATHRSELANYLLLPFNSVTPTPGVQALIRNFLLGNYIDPRIKRGNWSSVSEKALAVMMRWLVHATLDDFFRVVREGSHQDKDADRMWPYREAFWSAYLRKGVITDAWVVLGEAIAHKAKYFLDAQKGSYGRLDSGYGVKPVHAVLILRIGDLVITEWNHMGKYRVWHADNQRVPKFYKSTIAYSRNELTHLPDFDGSHHSAKHGGWQEKLSTLITEWTGVKVTKREYMPQ